MGSKKVEEKLQTLIHAFYEQKELSAKDIQNLLVCNRASTYNYIERLKERGFELESTTRNKTAYYTLISEDPSAPPVYYLPISKEILRKYNVIQNLQRKHDTAKLLKDRYFLPGNNSKTDDNCDKLPMDITKTAFDNLWNALIQEKEIAITSDGTYHATGRSVPILHHFSKETVSKLLEQVKLLPAASPYHSQLNSIAHKLEIIKLSDNLGSVSSPNYLTYGKQHEMLEEINQWMKKLSDSSYAEKLIRITYKTKAGQMLTILFQTGLVIYSVEKAKLYLLGKEYTEEPALTEKYNSIIDMSRISTIENTDFPNDSYRSTTYQHIFSEMFSISLEEPLMVKVRFDLEANVKRKIHYLKQHRSGASITYFPEENQLEYQDTIRGLGDFANYLRQFGRSVHVIEPASLKDNLYCVLSVSENKIQVYRLDRILDLRPGTEKVDAGDSSIIDSIAPQVWGNCFSEKPEHIKVKFYNEANVWEKVKRDLACRTKGKLYEKDGYLYYEDTVYGISKFRPWIYGFGSSAIVQEPKSLRDHIIKSLKERKNRG